MARVTLNEAKQMIDQSQGVSVFSAKPGSYHMIFLGDESGIIQYMNPVHQVLNAKGQFGKVRCVKDHFEYVEGTNELKRNSSTGEVLNDGSCPYCEIHWNYRNFANAEMDKFRQENPGASEEVEKAQWRKVADKNPVKRPEFLRTFLVAIVELNEMGRPARTADGKLAYKIQPIKITPNQYEKKLLPAMKTIIATQDEGMEDDGLTWHEFTFQYPDTGQKVAEMYKDMTISAAMIRWLEKEPTLQAEISEQVAKMDLNGLEDKMGFFRPQSIEQIVKRLSAQAAAFRPNMSEAERSDVAAKLANETKSASADEVANLVGGTGEAPAAPVAPPAAPPAPATDGAAAFGGASASDVDDLLK